MRICVKSRKIIIFTPAMHTEMHTSLHNKRACISANP